MKIIAAAFPSLAESLGEAAVSICRAARLPGLLLLLSAGLNVASAATPPVTALPDDPACTADDRKFMARAYELATIASANGNGAFGALVVKDGRILAEFSNNAKTSGDVSHHGETGLVSYASVKLGATSMKGCTFATSAEP